MEYKMQIKNINYKFLIIIIILIGVISCKEKSKNNSTFIPITIKSNKPIDIKLSKIINIGTLNIQDDTATIDKDNSYFIKQKSSKLTMCVLLAKDTAAVSEVSIIASQRNI